MDEPRILKFPTVSQATTADTPIGADDTEPDLAAILHAWNEATDRLQRTHESLRAEIRRLTNELEAKNRELARQDRLADLGQMASHVAHEVRNSLVPMKLYLSLLRRRISGDAGSADVIDKVTAGFAALEATVSDLLHFSSDREPQWLTFSMPDFLNEICDSLAPQLTAQGIRHEIDCPQLLSVRADRDMLRRALLNLILNAIDAMPRGGLLTITVCPSAVGIEIEIGDSGPGIAEDLVDRLFEPFVTTKSHGTGLGLAIVERIAQAHGGQVVAMNGAEGGAAFTLTIPHHARAAEKAA
jgi:Signal transduction histidine kinase